MPTLKFEGQLEIDQQRGVIYFHSAEAPTGGATLLRINRLPTPIPNPLLHPGVGILDVTLLDVTHMHGTSWKTAVPCNAEYYNLRCLEPEGHPSEHIYHVMQVNPKDDPDLYCTTCGKGPFDSKMARGGHMKGAHGGKKDSSYFVISRGAVTPPLYWSAEKNEWVPDPTKATRFTYEQTKTFPVGSVAMNGMSWHEVYTH